MAKRPNPDGLMAHRLDLEEWNEVPFRWVGGLTFNTGDQWLVVDRFWTDRGDGTWDEAVALALYGPHDEPLALHCLPANCGTYGPFGFNYWKRPDSSQ